MRESASQQLFLTDLAQSRSASSARLSSYPNSPATKHRAVQPRALDFSVLGSQNGKLLRSDKSVTRTWVAARSQGAKVRSPKSATRTPSEAAQTRDTLSTGYPTPAAQTRDTMSTGYPTPPAWWRSTMPSRETALALPSASAALALQMASSVADLRNVLWRIASSTSLQSPFVPTDPHNSEQRAARTVLQVCEAFQNVMEKRIRPRHVSTCHCVREEATAWDQEPDNREPLAVLPATSALAMQGSMKLGISSDDWPPAPDAAESKPFQHVWMTFPEARGRHYANSRGLLRPERETLVRFERDMGVQVGFAMDVMLGDHTGPVAMVFNPVGAGAFLDRLPKDDQSKCLHVILSLVLSEFVRRLTSRSHCHKSPCVLFISGSQPAEGWILWKSKLGAEAALEIPAAARGHVFVGAFDCLTVAQNLANLGFFENVAMIMAADKNRIGNTCLNVRKNRQTCKIQFASWNAPDESSARRSSLLPMILFVNAPFFNWRGFRGRAAIIAGTHRVMRYAQDYLGSLTRDDYDEMMSAYDELLKRGPVAQLLSRNWALTIPALAQKLPDEISTVPIGGAAEHGRERVPWPTSM